MIGFETIWQERNQLELNQLQNTKPIIWSPLDTRSNTNEQLNRSDLEYDNLSVNTQINRYHDLHEKCQAFNPQLSYFSSSNITTTSSQQATHLNSYNHGTMVMSREQALVTLTEKTSYPILQENGQRRYGPPPDWIGPQPPRGCEVFIGKIPRDCFEDELVPVFETVGRIYMFRLMMDFSGCNRGYGFCIYTNREDTRRAVAELNSYEIRKGKMLGVCFSVDNCRLFVGGIPKTKTRDEIMSEMLKVTDGVKEVIVYPSIADKTKNRGFAFVEYENHKAAAMARRKLIPGRIHLWGHQIAVDWAEPEREVAEDIMSKVRILYVRNLMLHTTEESLRDHFNNVVGAADAVERVKKIRDYAFVHFRDRLQATIALRRLDGAILDGSRIEVTWAKPVDKNDSIRNCRNSIASQIQTLSNLSQYTESSGLSAGQFTLGKESAALCLDSFGLQNTLSKIHFPVSESILNPVNVGCNGSISQPYLSIYQNGNGANDQKLQLSAFTVYKPSSGSHPLILSQPNIIHTANLNAKPTNSSVEATSGNIFNNLEHIQLEKLCKSPTIQPSLQISRYPPKHSIVNSDLYTTNAERTRINNELVILCTKCGLGMPELQLFKYESNPPNESQCRYFAQLFLPALQKRFYSAVPSNTPDEAVNMVTKLATHWILSLCNPSVQLSRLNPNVIGPYSFDGCTAQTCKSGISPSQFNSIIQMRAAMQPTSSSENNRVASCATERDALIVDKKCFEQSEGLNSTDTKSKTNHIYNQLISTSPHVINSGELLRAPNKATQLFLQSFGGSQPFYQTPSLVSTKCHLTSVPTNGFASSLDDSRISEGNNNATSTESSHVTKQDLLFSSHPIDQQSSINQIRSTDETKYYEQSKCLNQRSQTGITEIESSQSKEKGFLNHTTSNV